MSLFIGIDLGTSACKLLLMDEGGKILNIVSKEYPVEFPRPGWSQQDPDDWWLAVREGVPELLSGFDAAQVAGIGCGGQMHGLVVLDGDDAVIRPAILWNDGRTEAQVRYLNEEVGTDKLLAWTGNIAFAGFTAPKILWMRDEEPELFARIAHIMLPKDYLSYKLTGVNATDASDAAGMLLLDVDGRRWSPHMLELCGISESQLPRVFESWEAVGRVRDEVADELGLPHGVVVAAGAGDNAAAAVGTGVVGAGSCNISLGTSGTVFIPTSSFAAGLGDKIHSFCHADGGWHLMGCILSAASCNKWWVEDILGAADFAAEQAGIDADAVTPDLPYFLPYLMGERTPHNDTAARGAFVGMNMATTRSDMTRAVLEGVAFAIRDSVEIARGLGVELRKSMICGGGSKSRLWMEMLANVCNLTLEMPETEQGPGYGGAILAAVAAGAFPSVGAACEQLVHVRGTVEPQAELVSAYEARYQVWRGLYPALKSSFKQMQ